MEVWGEEATIVTWIESSYTYIYIYISIYRQASVSRSAMEMEHLVGKDAATPQEGTDALKNAMLASLRDDPPQGFDPVVECWCHLVSDPHRQ